MENIFRRRKSKDESTSRGLKKPEIVNLTKKFLEEMKEYSQIQKINMVYSNIVGKKPDLKLDTNKKLNRILFEQRFGKQIKHTEDFLKNKKKYKFPSKWIRRMKEGNKKGRQILVWYLNSKGIIELPKLHPIYSSDMIIIRNKPHQVDPRAFWRLDKYQCLLIKEIDRRPVSNLDYDEIKKRGDSTDSDEFIIKAAMQAVVGGPKTKQVDKKVIIIIAVLILGAIVYFMSK